MKRVLIGLLMAIMVGPTLVMADDNVFPKKGPVGITGWVDFLNPDSVATFEKHADQMDRVFLKSYTMQTDMMPHPVDAATPQLKARVMAAAARNNVVVFLNCDNFNPIAVQYEGKTVEKMIHDGKIRDQHIQTLINYALRDGVKGVQVDYRKLDDNFKGIKNRGEFKDFVDKLSKACKANHLICGVEVAHKENRDGGDEYQMAIDYPGISGMIDQITPMNDNQNENSGVAAAYSSPEYGEVSALYVATLMNPAKMILTYPNSGFDWVGNHQVKISQRDFADLAKKYNVAPRRDVNYSQEVSLEYTDAQGKEHKAWMTDDRCLEIYCDLVKKYKLYGIGLRCLGGEVDTFWDTLKKVNATQQTTANLLPAEPPPSVLQNLKPVHIFTDLASNTYAYVYPTEGENAARHGGSKYFIIKKNVSRWADIQLEGDQWSGGALGCPVFDMTPYLEKGALQFLIKGVHGDEMMEVGFEAQKTVKERLIQYGFVTTRPITDYIRVTTNWQLVTIPLSDFKITGASWSERQGQTVYNLFKWTRVSGFEFDIAPTADPDFHIQLAGIRIIPTYDVKAVAKQKESMQ